jgi:hypothetical protein
MLHLHLASKHLELLKETAPTITRIAIVANPHHPGFASELTVTRVKRLGLEIELFDYGDDTLPLVVEGGTKPGGPVPCGCRGCRG